MSTSLRERYAPPVLAFLRELGADRIRHSRRTLFDHLVGTAELLERWGAEDDVCRAGLCHSIYGTEYFHGGVLTFDDRPRVREILGERAERLAYIFCAFDRRSVYTAIAKGEPYSVELLKGAGQVPITKTELTDLVWIVWSNAVEQVPTLQRFTPEARQRSLRAIDKCRPFLPAAACEELRATYETSTLKP